LLGASLFEEHGLWRLLDDGSHLGERHGLVVDLDLADLDGLGGKTVIFGVVSMGDPQPETAQTVARRIRAALAHVPPERLIPAPDCGMKYLPRDIAFAKLKALADGAAIVRRELTGA